MSAISEQPEHELLPVNTIQQTDARMTKNITEKLEQSQVSVVINAYDLTAHQIQIRKKKQGHQ